MEALIQIKNIFYNYFGGFFIDFIASGLGFLAIYIGMILAVSKRLTNSVGNQLTNFLRTVENHNGQVDEQLFKRWVDEYENILLPESQLISFKNCGLLLTGSLLFAGLLEGNILPDLMIIIYSVILICAIFTGIYFLNLISWIVNDCLTH